MEKDCKRLALEIAELFLISYGGLAIYKPTGETFNLKQLREYLKINKK